MPNTNTKDVSENNKIENPFITVEKIKPDLRKKDPPLVDIKVSNPITYIKSFWKRVVGNEGMEIRIKIKPLTAILITVIVISLCLGVTRVILPFKIPFLEVNTEVTPTPTPISSRQTAFAGTLRFIKDNEYFLETNSSEAIGIEIPENVNLKKFVGRRIFAKGEYYESDRLLKIADISDLEIFPEDIIFIPTLQPSPTSSPTPTPTANPTEMPIVTEEPTVLPSSSPILE